MQSRGEFSGFPVCVRSLFMVLGGGGGGSSTDRHPRGHGCQMISLFQYPGRFVTLTEWGRIRSLFGLCIVGMRC